MAEITAGVNWLAVFVGFFVSFILGWLWYSPRLFGKSWAAGVGIELNTNQPPPVAALVVQALGTFCLSWVVGVTAASNALITLLLIVFTITIILAGAGLFVKKSSTAIFIEVGYIFAMTIIMIASQGLL